MKYFLPGWTLVSPKDRCFSFHLSFCHPLEIASLPSDDLHIHPFRKSGVHSILRSRRIKLSKQRLRNYSCGCTKVFCSDQRANGSKELGEVHVNTAPLFLYVFICEMGINNCAPALGC